jgi:hypothetical protein
MHWHVPEAGLHVSLGPQTTVAQGQSAVADMFGKPGELHTNLKSKSLLSVSFKSGNLESPMPVLLESSTSVVEVPSVVDMLPS